jgi:parallel beta-helix repeat protein
MNKVITKDAFCLNCMNEKGPVAVCPVCHATEIVEALSPEEINPGTILRSRYLVGKSLTNTAYSITYLGYDFQLSAKVRIREFFPKFLVTREKIGSGVLLKNPDEKKDFDFGKRKFSEETRTLALLKPQPGFSHIIDGFEQHGTIYRITHHPEGERLSDLLARKSDRPPRQKLLDCFRPLMLTLEELHKQGLLHYQLTPKNIIIGPDNVATLVDFSGADAVMAHLRGDLYDFFDAHYTPPEFYTNLEAARPTSEVYALGAIFFHLLTGKPLPQVTEHSIETFSRYTLPKGIPKVVLKTLAYATMPDPHKRFKNIGQLRLVLTEIWRSQHKRKKHDLSTAFQYVDCLKCGMMNEVLATDLESGTSTCFACGQPLITGSKTSEATAAISLHPPTDEFTIKSTGKAFFDVKRKPPSDEPEFVKVSCPICKAPNEVLAQELGGLATCTICGEKLPENAEVIGESDEELLLAALKRQINDLIREQQPAPENGATPENKPSPPEEAQEPPAVGASETAEQTDVASPKDSAAPAPQNGKKNTTPPQSASSMMHKAGDILDAELKLEGIPVDMPSSADIAASVETEKAEKTKPQPQAAKPEKPPKKAATSPKRSGAKKLAWVILTVLLLGAVAGGGYYYWQQKQQAEADYLYASYLEKADRFFDEQNYSSAATNYQLALLQKPDAAYPKQRLQAAQAKMLETLQENTPVAAKPDSSRLRHDKLFRLADSLERVGDFEFAGEIYQQIAIEFPGDSLANIRLKNINRRLVEKSIPKTETNKPEVIEISPSDDFAQKITAAPPFATIRVARGIYELTSPITLKYDLKFEGVGSSFSVFLSQSGETIFRIENGATITMRNVGFNRTNAPQDAPLIEVADGDLDLNNGEFRDAQPLQRNRQYAALRIINKSRGSIRNSRFNNHAVGLLLENSAAPLIEKCEFWGNGTAILVSDNARPRIRNNQIRRNIGTGIAVSGSAQPIIADNQITENRENGIVFRSERFSGTTSGNTISENRGTGIVLGNNAQPTIEENTIALNNNGGILVEENAQGIIRSNTIERNKVFGIRVANKAAPQIQRNIIKNNQGDGIEVLNTGKPIVRSNEILQNRGDGISLLLEQNGGLLQDNTLQKNQGYGISILKKFRPDLINNTINGNYEGEIYDETAPPN